MSGGTERVRVAASAVRTRVSGLTTDVRRRTDPVFDPLREDLRADPTLRYVLLFALVVCAFGLWFRVPNFADPDEYSRLVQPMKAAGFVAADSGLDSFRTAILDGRALGATFYLYGAVLAPMFVVVLISGQLAEFVALGGLSSRWTLWHAAPAWFWTGAVLLGRLVNVVFAVGVVYLTYRLGNRYRDRFTGRLAAVLLSLSVGFVGLAHVLAEDVPMLFFLLSTVVLAHGYVETGARRYFYAGALTGGLAIAFKLSGGVAAVVLGVAYFERARRQADTTTALARPAVLLGGLVIGLLTVTVGIPSVLVGGPEALLDRVTQSMGSKTTRSGGLDAPTWYWFLRQYVRGLGVPLLLAVVAGVAAAVGRSLARRDGPSSLAVLLATTLLVFFAVYSRWEFIRLRHLVPTFPVLLVVLSGEVSRYWGTGDRVRLLRGALAVLVVTSGAGLVAAEYKYVTDPRDGATEYLAENMDDDDAVEVYENSIADVGVPHGANVSHYPYPENQATNRSSLVFNETAYTEWMLAMPDREPEYVQLTGEELAYVTPTSPRSEQYPERRQFVRSLQRGDSEYTRVAAYGDRTQPETLREDLLQAAFDPELPGLERYVAVYAREA